MEIGGDGVKVETHNLRDLLRMKEEEEHQHVSTSISTSSQSLILNGGGGTCSSSSSSSSGLTTLVAALSDKRSSRTLYDIIREERMSGENSWRELTEKIRRYTNLSSSVESETEGRRSLMTLLSREKETRIMEEEEEELKKKKNNDNTCIICMCAQKGAAFIPCGHTFCRDCSREVWLQRPNCPVCNQLILQILNIF